MKKHACEDAASINSCRRAGVEPVEEIVLNYCMHCCLKLCRAQMLKFVVADGTKL